MSYRQIVGFNPSRMGTKRGWCLQNVRFGFGIGTTTASAKADMQFNKDRGTFHPLSEYDRSTSVPVYIDSTSVYEHVGCLHHGVYYSDGRVATLPTNRVFGWGEYCSGTRVVQKVAGGNSSTGSISGTTYNGVNYAPVFNATYYFNKYADLQKAIGNNAAGLFQHFVTYGMKEHRQACANFNVDIYKANYGDLQKAFGNDIPAYYKHYCTNGKNEGRNAVNAPAAPAASGHAPKASGSVTCTAVAVKVRTQPSLKSGDTGSTYKKGSKLNYQAVVQAEGYYWLKYTSYSGAVHYCAYGTVDGSRKFWG